MRIAILGNSGSGKSTLARRLADLRGLEPLDLDGLAWEPGLIAVPRDPMAALAEVAAACTTREHWIIEGCYADLIRATLPHGPILVFLKPGVDTCLAHCLARPWEPHKYASKAEQDGHLAFLLTWVREYDSREGPLSLRAHQALFDAYGGPKHQRTIPPDQAFIEALLNPSTGA